MYYEMFFFDFSRTWCSSFSGHIGWNQGQESNDRRNSVSSLAWVRSNLSREKNRNRCSSISHVCWIRLHMTNNAWQDGSEGVTDCGIAPHSAFTYKFGTNQHQGSHWYHSHSGAQYGDGLQGPFVIEHPGLDQIAFRHRYVKDQVLFIQDWSDPRTPFCSWRCRVFRAKLKHTTSSLFISLLQVPWKLPHPDCEIFKQKPGVRPLFCFAFLLLLEYSLVDMNLPSPMMDGERAGNTTMLTLKTKTVFITPNTARSPRTIL